MDVSRPEEIGGGLEVIECFAHENGVGAQIDEALAFYQRRHNLIDLPVDERLTASDGDDRRAALLNCVDTLLNGKSPRQDILVVLYLAAAGHGKVTLIQRL